MTSTGLLVVSASSSPSVTRLMHTWKEWKCSSRRIISLRQQVRVALKQIEFTEVGDEVYSTLSNLLAPTKPKDTPFVDTVRVLEKHYNPKPLEIAQSFHFGTRNQKSGELRFIV